MYNQVRFFPLNWLGVANLKYFIQIKTRLCPPLTCNVIFKKFIKFVASLWQLHYLYLRTKFNAWGLEAFSC